MIRCANSNHTTDELFDGFYHASIEDVKACSELSRMGWTKQQLNGLADGVRIRGTREVVENIMVWVVPTEVAA